MIVCRRSEWNVRLVSNGDDDDDDDDDGGIFIYLDEYRDLHFGEYASIEDKLRQKLKLSNCNMTFT